MTRTQGTRPNNTAMVRALHVRTVQNLTGSVRSDSAPFCVTIHDDMNWSRALFWSGIVFLLLLRILVALSRTSSCLIGNSLTLDEIANQPLKFTEKQFKVEAKLQTG